MKTTTFKTNDISFTSYLLTQGIELLEVKKENHHHFAFVLSWPEKCDELKRKFLNNALAPAQELFSKREMLITEIKNKNLSNVSKVVKGSTVTSVQAKLNKSEQSERRPTEATDIPIINS